MKWRSRVGKKGHRRKTPSNRNDMAKKIYMCSAYHETKKIYKEPRERGGGSVPKKYPPTGRKSKEQPFAHHTRS